METTANEATSSTAGSLWAVGAWLSAALDDPDVCDAMKADVREWFDGGGHISRGCEIESVADDLRELSRNWDESHIGLSRCLYEMALRLEAALAVSPAVAA